MSRNTENSGEISNPTGRPKADHQIQDYKAQASIAEAQGDWKTAAKY